MMWCRIAGEAKHARIGIALLLTVVSGCGASDEAPIVTTPTEPKTTTSAPTYALSGTDSLLAGEQGYFYLMAFDSAGKPLTSPTVSWQVDASRATTAPAGAASTFLNTIPLGPAGPLDVRAIVPPPTTGDASSTLSRSTRVISPLAPAPMTSAPLLSSVSAGEENSCGIDLSGQVWCWGSNLSGILNAANLTSTVAPVAIALPARAVQLSLGATHACAVGEDGAAYCWGDPTFGALGPGLPSTGIHRTVLPAPIAMVSAGGRHSCALTTGGEAYCWGEDEQGQLGAAPTTDYCGVYPYYCRVNPVRAAASLRFLTLSAGASHTCGIATDSLTYCWGSEAIGTPSYPQSCAFFPRTGPGPHSTPCSRDPVRIPVGKQRAVSAFAVLTCGLAADGAAGCWSTDAPSTVAGPRLGMISAGETHACGVGLDHLAYCWGSNLAGQAGQTGTTMVPTPTAVPGAGPGAMVSAGRSHSCSLTSTAIAVCWGDPRSGRLGRRE